MPKMLINKKLIETTEVRPIENPKTQGKGNGLVKIEMGEYKPVKVEPKKDEPKRSDAEILKAEISEIEKGIDGLKGKAKKDAEAILAEKKELLTKIEV